MDSATRFGSEEDPAAVATKEVCEFVVAAVTPSKPLAVTAFGAGPLVAIPESLESEVTARLAAINSGKSAADATGAGDADCT